MIIASRSIASMPCCNNKKSCSIKCNKIKAIIKTSKGDITVELNAQSTPKTVENFIRYAKEGQYKDTVFHRVISNFMIQGGEYKTDGSSRKPKYPPIKSESSSGLKNTKGTIAMARTNRPDSAKAQFFINTRNNPSLDHSSKKEGYTAFGTIVKGMDVVNKIKISKTNNKNWPKDLTIIYDVKIKED